MVNAYDTLHTRTHVFFSKKIVHTLSIIYTLIDNPRVTLSIMALVLFAGFVSRVNLPVETEPAVDVPVAMVRVIHHGISPDDGIRLLARPIGSR